MKNAIKKPLQTAESDFKYKNLLLAGLSYMLLILLWAFAYRRNIYSDNGALINFLSYSIAFLYFNSIYVISLQRNARGALNLNLFQIFAALFSAFLLYEESFRVVAFAGLIYLVISFLLQLKMPANERISYPALALAAASICVYYFSVMTAAWLLMAAAVFINTYLNYGYRKFWQISFVFFNKKGGAGIFFFLLAFIFAFILISDLDAFFFQIIFHIFLMLAFFFMLFSMKNIELSEKKIEDFYLLAAYLADERDVFASVLHDEIIQDIKAARTLLTLNKPDTARSSQILKDLEIKIRKMMNFYSANLFDYFDFNENFVNMLDSIKALYPQKDLQIEYLIAEDLRPAEEKLIMQISKELINNIFKHSKAEYILYNSEASKEKIKIYCESDKADLSDLKRIENSQGGVLLLKLLINKYRGEINYRLDGDLLKTEISLEREKIDETAFV